MRETESARSGKGQIRHPPQSTPQSTVSYSPRRDGDFYRVGQDESQRQQRIDNTPADWRAEPARDGRASLPAVNRCGVKGLAFSVYRVRV
jgi:hypothetical protein